MSCSTSASKCVDFLGRKSDAIGAIRQPTLGPIESTGSEIGRQE